LTRNERFSGVVICLMFAAQGCRATSPDWNGSWKLNPTKSGYQGYVVTISISADGEYHFDGNSSIAVLCDGKERPIGDNRTRACVQSGNKALDITQRENGVKTKATRDELSTDGNVLTATVTEFQPNRPVIPYQIVFSRLSGSSDHFAGRWRDTSYFQHHADMTVRLDNQALHIEYPSAGEHIDVPLDGAEGAVAGPRVLEGTTCAVRSAGDREFLMVTKRNGKVFSQGSLKLSDDGKMIINSWWNPDRPDDVGTLTYEKR
jgi:hypothetical protein